MRGWLMFRAFDIGVNVHMMGLYDGTLSADLAPLAPARLVPVIKTPAGHVVQDTLAIAETLAEAHPDKNMWPSDPAHRALARGITAEMHAGFSTLRGDCPMILQNAWAGFAPSSAVLADVARIETLWDMAFELSGSDGWLFGDYSIADAFYAPVAARIAGYGLPVGPRAARYVEQHLHHSLCRQWRSMGMGA